MEEDEDYIPNEDKRVDAELEDVPYDNEDFTMHRPTLERQAVLRKSSTGHKAIDSGYVFGALGGVDFQGSLQPKF